MTCSQICEMNLSWAARHPKINSTIISIIHTIHCPILIRLSHSSLLSILLNTLTGIPDRLIFNIVLLGSPYTIAISIKSSLPIKYCLYFLSFQLSAVVLEWSLWSDLRRELKRGRGVEALGERSSTDPSACTDACSGASMAGSLKTEVHDADEGDSFSRVDPGTCSSTGYHEWKDSRP